MKVLHINAFYGFSSTGSIVEDIHNLSLENGIESYAAFSTSTASLSKITNYYAMGNIVDKKLHALLSRINGRQGYFSHFSTKKLLKHIEKIKPDIVHLHNLHANYININMLLDYLGKNDISTVITLHDCWFYTGGCYHYTGIGCYKWQDSCLECPKKHTDLKSHFLDKASSNLSDRKKYFDKIKDLTLVGVSNWISNEAKMSILKDKSHTVIYNGIDTSLFVNTPSDLREKYGIGDKFVILGLASKWLDPINKEAFDYITSNLPNDSVLMLFGCEDEQIKSLPKNVIGIGYINDKKHLVKIYSMADIMINCSREDTLSLINVEPQACGTPVIAYRNTGGAETVDNACSFSVDDGDYKSLFEKIMEIKSNGKSTYSDLCREHAVSKFDKRENYKKYIELYKEIYRKN